MQPEPYKIKMVEPVSRLSRDERLKAIEKAGYNTFLLRSADVYIDLLTDSGTSAMSDRQWAALMLGDEAYAGSRNFTHLQEAVNDYYGYRYVVPTHQGRGAEHIISQLLIEEGDYVPGNMYFTTTKLHQELAGGTFVDVITEEAHEPANSHPFKGNIDIEKLERLIEEVGPARIPYISLATCVNMAGGQPLSLANLQKVRQVADKHNILIIHDMTRVAENAYFIQQREEGQQERSIGAIVKNICRLTDGATMSAKKDPMVNIGGFLALNDKELFRKAKNRVVVYEGLHTYGGMAGRDMEALAVGIKESLDDDHIAHRVEQVNYLGKKLAKADIPIVQPIGGHGVFLNAKQFLPHIAQSNFPAQALASAIYIEGGIRTMERGSVSAGRDPSTGRNKYPALELVRLTIPRRVYTQTHLDYVADKIKKVYQKRHEIEGLAMTYEPEYLRFFQGRFRPIPQMETVTDA